MSPKPCEGGSAVEIIVTTSQKPIGRSSDLSGVPAASIRGCTRSFNSASGPMYCPREKTSIASRGPPEPTSTAVAAATALSAAGALAIRLLKVYSTASAASAPFQSKRYHDTVSGLSTNENSKAVLIPKLPPAPPRQAQKRSAFSDGLSWSTSPEAVTMREESMWSHVSPAQCVWYPMPPPRARPPTPTPKQVPPGRKSGPPTATS